MEIQLIRNATLRLSYAGKTILIDPDLAPKHSRKSIAGREENPTTELPLPPHEITAGIDAILVSHLHQDHFDPTEDDLLPKDVPVFCQPGDKETIEARGFMQVRTITDEFSWNGLTITRTPGQHGQGPITERMGEVSGFVFRAEEEPTLYWLGDTIWCKEVEQVITETDPDVLVTHSSGAALGDSGPIVMDALQTIALCKYVDDKKVVAVHLDALDHGTTTREQLRTEAEKAAIPTEQLLIPDDGETLSFE